MHDPLILAAKLADAVGMENGASRDVKCLQLARWMREEGAVSGNFERLQELAVALDQRFAKLAQARWEAVLFLLAAGSSRRIKNVEIPCPRHLRGLTRAQVQNFVLTGKRPRRSR